MLRAGDDVQYGPVRVQKRPDFAHKEIERKQIRQMREGADKQQPASFGLFGEG